MNTFRIVAPSVSALLLVFGMASSSWAFPDTMPGSNTVREDPALQPCEKHGPNADDCHIHDEDTYLHMKRDVPRPGNDHAWSEFRAWEKHYRNLHR